jgi:hypothetical protein
MMYHGKGVDEVHQFKKFFIEFRASRSYACREIDRGEKDVEVSLFSRGKQSKDNLYSS